jgi:hypothetical protein
MEGEVSFLFLGEDTLVEKQVRALGITETNFSKVEFLPKSSDDHDIDDFLAENIEVKIKRIDKDFVTFYCIAPEGATGFYKFKYKIWQLD